MKKLIFKVLSFVGLLLTVGPSFLVLNKVIDIETSKNLMILGTLLWFLTAPWWVNKHEK